MIASTSSSSSGVSLARVMRRSAIRPARAAVMMAVAMIPVAITKVARKRMPVVCGAMSPYPTVDLGRLVQPLRQLEAAAPLVQGIGLVATQAVAGKYLPGFAEAGVGLVRPP